MIVPYSHLVLLQLKKLISLVFKGSRRFIFSNFENYKLGFDCQDLKFWVFKRKKWIFEADYGTFWKFLLYILNSVTFIHHFAYSHRNRCFLPIFSYEKYGIFVLRCFRNLSNPNNFSWILHIGFYIFQKHIF